MQITDGKSGPIIPAFFVPPIEKATGSRSEGSWVFYIVLRGVDGLFVGHGETQSDAAQEAVLQVLLLAGHGCVEPEA